MTKGAVLAEIETDKATVEVEFYFDGLVTRHLVTEGTVVPINTPIAVIAAPGEQVDYKALFGEVATVQVIKKTDEEEKGAVATVVLAETTSEVPPALVIEGQIPEGVRASPLARRIAAERGINLTSVKGSGPGGRITKKDIETFEVTPAAPTVTAAPAAPNLVTSAIPSEAVPLNRLRAAIGRRMTEAKQQVPHFYVTHEYDVAALLDLRKQMNTLLSDDERLSVNDFIVKAVALTLRQFPNLNASLQGSQVIQHTPINIGNAVTVEGGLLTVVCRGADLKPLNKSRPKSVQWLSVPVREKYIPMILKVPPSRSATWVCSTLNTLLLSSTRLKQLSLQWVLHAKCPLWLMARSSQDGE